MHKKLSVAGITAITALSFGIAHAQNTQGNPSPSGSPSETSAPKSLTKAEAAKQGISEARFKALDTNNDGLLDSKELQAAGTAK